MKSIVPLDPNRGGSAHDLPQASGLSPEELSLVTAGRPNTLLTGSPAALAAALTALRPLVVRPLTVATGSQWHPPPSSTATLIVEQIAGLSAEQQRAMIEWFDGLNDHVQVICTSDRPVYNLVERGTFDPHLFYRLNVVTIEV